jgi:bacteriocin biosynthesis cyclodehydratase domain-containing protein
MTRVDISPKKPATEDRFVVNPHLRIVYVSDDEIAVRHSGRSPTSRAICDEGGTKSIGKLLRSLKTPQSIEEISAGHADINEEQLRALISYLLDEQVLIKEGRDVIEVYLQSVLRGRQPLSALRVAVIGSGHLGSRIAQQMAQLGIGHLVLMDDRTVADAEIDARYFSLPRQSVTTGALYAEIVAGYLRKNSTAEVAVEFSSSRNRDALRRVLANVDCSVFASEHPGESAFHVMNEIALELRAPWMAVSLDGSEATIGPMFIPGESVCYNEYVVQAEAACYGVKDEFLTYREAMTRGDLGSQHLTLPSYSDIAAGMAATTLVRYLIGGKAFLMGRTIRYDFERLSVDTEEVLRLPRCPACAPGRSYRHIYL